MLDTDEAVQSTFGNHSLKVSGAARTSKHTSKVRRERTRGKKEKKSVTAAEHVYDDSWHFVFYYEYLLTWVLRNVRFSRRAARAARCLMNVAGGLHELTRARSRGSHGGRRRVHKHGQENFMWGETAPRTHLTLGKTNDT